VKRQTGNAALIVLLVLAVSLLGNLWLWKAKGEEHDARVKAEQQRDDANTATRTCNDSIDSIEDAARKQGAQAEKDRQAAAERRKQRNQKADKELATPATIPGDDCQSAKDRVARILSERKRP